MKRLKLLLPVFAAVLSGCVQEIDRPGPADEADGQVVPYAIYASSADTRTVNSGLSTEWEAGDRIGVFHEESGSGTFVADGPFVLTEENHADNLFLGVLSEPLAAESHDWYFIYPYEESMASPDVDAGGYITIGAPAGESQLQKGNDSMAHIAGKNYPLYAVIKDVPSDETPSGMMRHMTSLVAVNVTNRTSAPLDVTSVGIKANESLTGSFLADISGEEALCLPLNETSVSSSATLVVEDVQVKEQESGRFYLAVKPFTAKAGSSLTVCVNGSEKAIRLPEDVRFEAGKIKTLNVSVESLAHPLTTMSHLTSMFDLDSTCRVDSGYVNGVPVDGFLVLGDEDTAGSVTLTGTIADLISMDEFGFYAASWTGSRSALTIKTITLTMPFLGYDADYTMTCRQLAEYVGLKPSVFTLRPYPAGDFDVTPGCHHLTILDDEQHYYGITSNEMDFLLSFYELSVEGLRAFANGEDNSYIEKLAALAPEALRVYMTEEMAEIVIPTIMDASVSVELSTMTEDYDGNKTDPRVAIWGMNVCYIGDL